MASTSFQASPQMDSEILDKKEVMSRLFQKIRTMETGGRQFGELTGVVSTGCDELDQELPEGGYVPGTMVEWLEPAAGCGGDYLVLMAARNAIAGGKYFIVVDSLHQFYPPAAVALGLPIDRIIVIRPKEEADAMWAIDQSLRCSAVGAVMARIDNLNELHARRFQLAAEAGGGLGLFIRPPQVRREPTWAEIQWLLEPPRSVLTPMEFAMQRASLRNNRGQSDKEQLFVSNARATRCFHLQSLRMRGGRSGSRWNVAVDMATGAITAERLNHVPSSSLRLASELAVPARSPASRTSPTTQSHLQSVRSASA